MLSLFIYAAFLSSISPIRPYTFKITPFRPILCCIPFVKNSILSFLGRPSFFPGDPPISFPTCIYHKKVHEKGINKFYKRDNDQTRSIRRAIHPHAVISSAVEKSSLHSVLPCPFRGRLPILLCHTYDAIPVCKKDRGLRSG